MSYEPNPEIRKRCDAVDREGTWMVMGHDLFECRVVDSKVAKRLICTFGEFSTEEERQFVKWSHADVQHLLRQVDMLVSLAKGREL